MLVRPKISGTSMLVWNIDEAPRRNDTAPS
jgi:hypothetical protein